ncbi:hypothetical protein FSPOR_11470 [Fusarium sporotrichioides]|uniref:Chromo domain-containing protein n=1 Tax=Fusarium sporotrichioides TaxID=5514 RepID=A0A395RGT7_FUSSP|nr:hypothetical protein FSPOR_11470 [Fusarium sporotrichioides]
MDERELQATKPELVYNWWKKFKGGRDARTGLDHWHPFHILGHRTTKKEYQYLVQWVGYDKNEATWEFADNLRDMSAELKNEYDEEHSLKG